MLEVGWDAKLTGDVSTLHWTGARPRADIERNLGLSSGRLLNGYWVCLLRQKPEPDEFEFSGTTMRSGGRLGLPAMTLHADKARPRVHDEIMKQYGSDHYITLQKTVLRAIAITGYQRIAKIVPFNGHSVHGLPAVQYPPGSGGLQWTLIKPCRFLVAAFVASDESVTTARFTTSISGNLSSAVLYENRHRLSAFLQHA